jgi:hypothetical protein
MLYLKQKTASALTEAVFGCILIYCYGRVRNFPKLDKHLLGNEILHFLNETHKFSLASIYNVSYLPLASANFDLFKKSLLIALDRKLISQGWYCAQLEIIVSIGKEIGKWLKKTKAPKY